MFNFGLPYFQLCGRAFIEGMTVQGVYLMPSNNVCNAYYVHTYVTNQICDPICKNRT